MRHTIKKDRLSVKWQRVCDANEQVSEIINELFKDNVFSVSRGQIFNETIPYKRIIKTLWWGYPNGMRVSRYFDNIINVAEEIADRLNDKIGQSLSEDEFLLLYVAIKELVGSGLGMSTISKLFYFFNISAEENKSVIVDFRVRSTMNYFEDFNPIHTANEARWYLAAVREINRVAGDWAKPDQIEYFLYGFQEH